MTYQNTAPRATAQPSTTCQRAAFARRAAIDAFGPRARHHLDGPNLKDQRPYGGPIRLGHVAVNVTGNVGQAALDHWLREAASASGEERKVAIEIAREIADMIGVPWSEIMSDEAA